MGFSTMVATGAHFVAANPEERLQLTLDAAVDFPAGVRAHKNQTFHGGSPLERAFEATQTRSDGFMQTCLIASRRGPGGDDVRQSSAGGRHPPFRTLVGER
jgi:hypothetical protein